MVCVFQPRRLVVKEEVSVLYVSELSLENESWPCKLKWHCRSSRTYCRLQCLFLSKMAAFV